MEADFYALSDQDIARLMGQRLRALRLRKNRTLEAVAANTAFSKNTISALENGRGKLENFIAVLRELGALDAIDAFLPEPKESPLAMAAQPRHTRQRASTKRQRPPSRNNRRSSDEW